MVAGLLGHSLGEGVGDRLGDERLTAPWRSVEQDPLGGLELVLEEHLRVEVGQLDGILDRLDLVIEATDVVIGDVGNLFEHELLDLRPRQALDQHPGATVHQHVVAGAQLLADQVVGELAHALLVGPADDQRAVLVLEQLLDDHDLAGDVGGAGEHDVERLVERDFLAALDGFDLDLGVHRDAHLAAGGEDVDSAVVVGAEERAVGRRGHGELLDLFPQRPDVLTGFAQGGGKTLVLGDGLGELALRLEDLLFEGADALGSVLQAATQDHQLFFQGLQLILEVADLAFVLGEAPVLLGSHGVTSLTLGSDSRLGLWADSGAGSYEFGLGRTLHRGRSGAVPRFVTFL